MTGNLYRIGRELAPQELLERQIENRLRFGPPVHLRIPARSWRDDVRDLIRDIAAEPGSHLAAFMAGIFVTCGSIIALAWAVTGSVL